MPFLIALAEEPFCDERRAGQDVIEKDDCVYFVRRPFYDAFAVYLRFFALELHRKMIYTDLRAAGAGLERCRRQDVR